MDEVFAISKKNMEDLLSELDVAACSLNPKYGLVVPKNHPALIARGTNSLVFELPPVESEGRKEYVVGKIFKYTESSTFDEVPEDEFHAVGCNSGLIMGAYGLPMTIHWLKQIEPSLDIPPMEEYSGSFGGKYLYFSIMPDLRQRGIYQVGEVDESLLKKLKNGDELRTNHKDLSARIIEGVSDHNLVLNSAGHGSEEDILPAIQHMFLVQYDAVNIGRLIAGDLNHFAIYEKGHQFGIEPEYLRKPQTPSTK